MVQKLLLLFTVIIINYLLLLLFINAGQVRGRHQELRKRPLRHLHRRPPLPRGPQARKGAPSIFTMQHSVPLSVWRTRLAHARAPRPESQGFVFDDATDDFEKKKQAFDCLWCPYLFVALSYCLLVVVLSSARASSTPIAAVRLDPGRVQNVCVRNVNVFRVRPCRMHGMSL